jgi:hypothetical protein
MRQRIASWLLRLYPRDWRERYGDELQELLESGASGISAVLNVIASALYERLAPASRAGGAMNAYFSSVLAMGRRPSAFVPISMSLAALVMVLVTVAVSGVQRGGDEGAAAHLWQILMAGQVPLLAFFLIKWLPRAPKATLSLLALQVLAALAAMAPVYILRL